VFSMDCVIDLRSESFECPLPVTCHDFHNDRRQSEEVKDAEKIVYWMEWAQGLCYMSSRFRTAVSSSEPESCTIQWFNGRFWGLERAVIARWIGEIPAVHSCLRQISLVEASPSLW
jgi:hypothetical protein